MNRADATAAVRSRRRARLFYGAGPREATHDEGRVIGYSDGPMVLIQTDDGRQVWWGAELTELTAGHEATTALIVEAIAWERAPRYSNGRVNRRVVCADGFLVSVQASSWHYANDVSGGAPYWKGLDPVPDYPFTTFEIGNPSDDPAPAEVWDEYESGGVWAWVPRQVVADLLDLHGGAVGWETAAPHGRLDG